MNKADFLRLTDLTPIVVNDKSELVFSDNVVAIDIETTGLNFDRCKLLSIQLFDGAHPYFIDVNKVPADVICDILVKSGIKTLLFFNYKFDANVLYRYNFNVSLFNYIDVKVLVYLDNPDNDIGLKDAIVNYFKVSKDQFPDLNALTVKLFGGSTNKKIDFVSILRASFKQGVLYAVHDAVFTWALYKLLYDKINNLCPDILRLELSLLEPLRYLEHNKVLVDREYLTVIKQDITNRIEALKSELYKQFGKEINLNSSEQLGIELGRFVNITERTGKKQQPSTSEHILQKYKSHPVVSLLLEYRKLYKLLSTYIEPLLEKDEHMFNFQQFRTPTGRLACGGGQPPYSHINAQNIPRPSEDTYNVRKAFISHPGYYWLKIDYSNIELRIAAICSHERVWLDIFKINGDVHKRTAASMFGIPESEVSKEQRTLAKSGNFGLLYGGSPKALVLHCGLSEDVAEDVYKRWWNAVPNVRVWQKQVIKQAQQSGFVKTLFGRRRYFDYDNKSERDIAALNRQAINTIVQGTAADIMKISIVKMYKWIKENNLFDDVKMLLTIHDELDFEVKKERAMELIPQILKILTYDKFSIPLTVEGGINYSWGELIDFKTDADLQKTIEQIKDCEPVRILSNNNEQNIQEVDDADSGKEFAGNLLLFATDNSQFDSVNKQLNIDDGGSKISSAVKEINADLNNVEGQFNNDNADLNYNKDRVDNVDNKLNNKNTDLNNSNKILDNVNVILNNINSKLDKFNDNIIYSDNNLNNINNEFNNIDNNLNNINNEFNNIGNNSNNIDNCLNNSNSFLNIVNDIKNKVEAVTINKDNAGHTKQFYAEIKQPLTVFLANMLAKIIDTNKGGDDIVTIKLSDGSIDIEGVFGKSLLTQLKFSGIIKEVNNER